MLAKFLRAYTAVLLIPCENSVFICLGTRYPRDFRFITHGRAVVGRRDVCGQHNQSIL